MLFSGLLGAISGVYVYDALFPLLSGLGGDQRFITLSMVLDIRYAYLAILLGAVFLSISLFLSRIDPSKRFDQTLKRQPLIKREWGWLPTGVIAGILIYLSTASGEYLSFSGGFLALGAYISSFFGQNLQSVPVLNESTAWRSLLILGVIPGALLSSFLAGTVKSEKLTPLFEAAFGRRLYLRLIMVFASGLLMIVGALTGGGCTTGAFMSAWPTLSIGSFVMGMVFFGTSMFITHLLYLKRYNLVYEVKERVNLIND